MSPDSKLGFLCPALNLYIVVYSYKPRFPLHVPFDFPKHNGFPGLRYWWCSSELPAPRHLRSGSLGLWVYTASSTSQHPLRNIDVLVASLGHPWDDVILDPTTPIIEAHAPVKPWHLCRCRSRCQLNATSSDSPGEGVGLQKAR